MNHVNYIRYGCWVCIEVRNLVESWRVVVPLVFNRLHSSVRRDKKFTMWSAKSESKSLLRISEWVSSCELARGMVQQVPCLGGI